MIRKHQLPKYDFQLTLVNPKPKQLLLLRPITTDSNTTMNQSGFEAVASSQRQARKKMRPSKPGLDLGLVLIGWETAGASLSIQSQRATIPRQTREFRHIRSYEFCLRLSNSIPCKTFYTTLVILNIAQTCDCRRISKCSLKS